jgi:hypothetical protein
MKSRATSSCQENHGIAVQYKTEAGYDEDDADYKQFFHCYLATRTEAGLVLISGVPMVPNANQT